MIENMSSLPDDTNSPARPFRKCTPAWLHRALGQSLLQFRSHSRQDHNVVRGPVHAEVKNEMRRNRLKRYHISDFI